MSTFSSDPRPSVWWMVPLLVPSAGPSWFPLFNYADLAAWGIAFLVGYQFLWTTGSARLTSLVCFKKTSTLTAPAKASDARSRMTHAMTRVARGREDVAKGLQEVHHEPRY